MLMSKKTIVLAMILINVLLSVLFVASNYAIWNKVNADDYSSPNWTPIGIGYTVRGYFNGELVYDGLVFVYNYPFWLFWVAIITNMLFAIILLRSKS